MDKVVLGAIIGATAVIVSQLVAHLFNLLTVKKGEDNERRKDYLKLKTETYKKIALFFFKINSKEKKFNRKIIDTKNPKSDKDKYAYDRALALTANWAWEWHEILDDIILKNHLWIDDNERKTLRLLLEELFRCCRKVYLEQRNWTFREIEQRIMMAQNFFDERLKKLYRWEVG